MNSDRTMLPDLGERVKELGTLYRVARLLQDHADTSAVLRDVVEVLSAAFAGHERTGARLFLGEKEIVSPDFRPGALLASASFTLADGTIGVLEAVDATKADRGAATPAEKEEFIKTVADMIRRFCDQRQSQFALRNSEERYRKLVEASSLIVWSVDGAGSDYYLPKWWELTGQTHAESRGNGWLDVVHPADRAAVGHAWDEALRTASAYVAEYRVKTAEGRYRHVLSRAVPIVQGGCVREWVGAIYDLTERREAEEALHETDLRFRQLAENVNQVFWMRTPNMSEILYVSPAYETIWGRPISTLVDDPLAFMKALHPADSEYVHSVLQREQRRAFALEYRIVKPDGEVRWIHDRGFPVLDASGTVYRIAGLAEDITERKQAEEHLQHSKNQLAEAQRLARIGSWNLDLTTMSLTWSDQHYHLFGLTPGSGPLVFNDSILEYVAPDDRDLVRAMVQRSINTGEPFSFHYRLPASDGEVRVIHSRGEVFCDESGAPVRLFGTAQDVTDIKYAEEQIRRSNEQLRALSARLESVREEESTRIARELHDELGSSLTSLRWDLEGLASAASSLPGDARLLERISQMLGHVDATITAVRRLSSELRPAILDDLGILDAVRWQLQQFQSRTGIACDYSTSVETVEVEKAAGTACFRIQQEILTNIIRHAQATSVSVRIYPEEGNLVITTTDNGRGVTDDEQSGRLSLGILGMRERAHLTGGTVRISGVPGQGTTVVLRIPLVAPREIVQLESCRNDEDSCRR